MASILGVTAIHHAPNLDIYRRMGTAATPSPTPSLSFADKSHINASKAQTSFSSGSRRNLAFSDGSSAGTFKSGFSSSAIATPNSILSEEAFKSLDGFSKDDFIDSQPNSSLGFSADSPADEDELAISKLGLPQRLTESLEKRGITSLFPIQVLSHSLAFLHVDFFC